MPSTVIAGSGTTTRSGVGTTTLGQRPWLLFFGDSKTAGKLWPDRLRESVTPRPWTLLNQAVGGTNVLSVTSIIATMLLAVPAIAETPTILLNWGVNDMGNYSTNGYGAATWIPAYLVILDAIRARWATAPIYVTKPWMRTMNVNADFMAGWVDTLVASRANVFVGTDERIYYKGSDDGATNTLEGVHPSPAGEFAIAAAWKVVLGW